MNELELAARSLAFLDWPEVLSRLAAEARSERGAEACRALQPAAELAEARAAMTEVVEMAGLLRASMATPDLGFPEIEAQLDAAEKQITMGAEDLKPIATFCELAQHARRFFSVRHEPAPPTPVLSGIASMLNAPPDLAPAIRGTFDASGGIRQGVDPELDRLRRDRDGLQSRVRSEIETIISSADWEPVLQDSYVTMRQDRFVVPVRASAKSMGLGIVHDTSRTGETVFVEPAAVVALNNRLKIAELDIGRAEQRILEELSGRVASVAPALRATAEAMGLLDAIAARARLSVAWDGQPVTLESRPVFQLSELRHPLLVMRAAREGFSVVPNDLRLGGEGPARVLVISGPNAGGKTVLLKSIGLAALLARSGMLVPAAPGGRVGFFEPVLAEIGDRQSVMADLSTFSAHLAGVAGMLRSAASPASEAALVLVDEIMAGTNPEQGAALARATVEAMAQLPVLAVVTTHFDGLKALAENDPRFRNAGMEYDLAELRPTFRLRDGAPGRSYALDIAGRMGLPDVLLVRARELAGDASVGIEDVLGRLEEREAELQRQTDAVARERHELEAATEEQRRAAEELAARRKELAHSSRDVIEQTVRDAREALRDIIRNAQAAGTMRAAEQARQAVEMAAESALRGLPRPEPPPGAPPPLVAGMRVKLPHLGGVEGVVAQVDDGRGRVRVTVRGKTLEVDAATLRQGAPAVAPRPRFGDGKGTIAMVSPPQDGLEHAFPTAACSLDLRGMRADVAEDELVAFLDRSALGERSPVFVIHGHGTGALRKMVREYLQTSPYVRKFVPGGKGQGGDGVTVVELK